MAEIRLVEFVARDGGDVSDRKRREISRRNSIPRVTAEVRMPTRSVRQFMTRSNIVFTAIAIAGVGCIGFAGWFMHVNDPRWFYWFAGGVVLLATIYDDSE